MSFPGHAVICIHAGQGAEMSTYAVFSPYPDGMQRKNRYCISALNTVLVAGDSVGGAAACFSGEDATCPTGSALRDLDLPTVQQEVATSLLIAGAWLGSMMASRPSDALGRRSVCGWVGLQAQREKMSVRALMPCFLVA